VPLRAERFFKALADGADELLGVDGGGGEALADKTDEVLGHNAVVKRFDASRFQLVGKVDECGKAVKLAALAQCAAPSIDGGDGVGGGAFAL